MFNSKVNARNSQVGKIQVDDLAFYLTGPLVFGNGFLLDLTNEDIIKAIRDRDQRLFDLLDHALSINEEACIIFECSHAEPDYHFRNVFVDIDERIRHAYVVLNGKLASEQFKQVISEDILPRLYREKTRAGQPSKKKNPIADAGLVYLIRADLENKPYKIGWTKNLDKRAKLFEVGLPFNFEVIHSFEADNARKAEASLHKFYADKRLNGEWFDLSDNDVEVIKTIIEYKNSAFLMED